MCCIPCQSQLDTIDLHVNRWLSLLNDHERSLLGVVVGVVHQERVGTYDAPSYYRILTT